MSRCQTSIGSRRAGRDGRRRHPVAVDAQVAEGRDELRHRVEERERALLVEHHRRDRGDRLGHRVDAPDRVGLDRQAGLGVALPAVRDVGDPPAARDDQQRALVAPVWPRSRRGRRPAARGARGPARPPRGATSAANAVVVAIRRLLVRRRQDADGPSLRGCRVNLRRRMTDVDPASLTPGESVEPPRTTPTRRSGPRRPGAHQRRAWPRSRSARSASSSATSGRARSTRCRRSSPPTTTPCTPTQADVYGVISLVFWTITIIVSIKYVTFIMRADNDGEGGIMALIALIQRARAAAAARRRSRSSRSASSARRCSTATG